MNERIGHFAAVAFTPPLSELSLTFSDAEGHGHDPVGAGDSVQTADEVGQVVQHAQVVLHHNDVPEMEQDVEEQEKDPGEKAAAGSSPVWGDEGADGDGSLQPLLHVQVTGRLIKHETAAEERRP